MESAFISAADVHAGLFSDGLETLEFAEFGGVVGIGASLVDHVAFGVGLIGHERVYVG